MDEAAVRASAQEVCDALVAGDIEGAIGHLSDELRRNLGEVVALLPLPATEATIESVERGGSGFVVVVSLVGETDQVQVQTRWKDRDGTPKIVEVSHLSRTARDEAAFTPEEEADQSEQAESA
jgi:tryptophan synthase alpha subunit